MHLNFPIHVETFRVRWYPTKGLSGCRDIQHKTLNMLAILVCLAVNFYCNFIMRSVVTLFVLLSSVVMLGADRLSVSMMGAFSLSDIMLCVIRLSAVILTVVLLSGINLSAITIRVVMLSVLMISIMICNSCYHYAERHSMLSAFMLSVVILSDIAPMRLCHPPDGSTSPKYKLLFS